MRKVVSKIEDVIAEIQKLKGQSVDLKVTRGRKKTQEIKGVIENLYPSIFTIRPHQDEQASFSYSYADVLCGDVVLSKTEDSKAVNNF